MQRYLTTYTDARGSEVTLLSNDGEFLSLTLRGVEFTGRDFDALETTQGTPEELPHFTFAGGCLCSCQLECHVPVPVHDRGRLFDGMLVVKLILGDPRPDGGLDREVLRLVLEYLDQRLVSGGTSGWFEDELLSIQAQLPEGVFIKACINCLYSDYSPYGHGLSGNMMCFRNLKADYLKITTKTEFWAVHGRQDRIVQETDLCDEFERRRPGTGYRG